MRGAKITTIVAVATIALTSCSATTASNAEDPAPSSKPKVCPVDVELVGDRVEVVVGEKLIDNPDTWAEKGCDWSDVKYKTPDGWDTKQIPVPNGTQLPTAVAQLQNREGSWLGTELVASWEVKSRDR